MQYGLLKHVAFRYTLETSLGLITEKSREPAAVSLHDYLIVHCRVRSIRVRSQYQAMLRPDPTVNMLQAKPQTAQPIYED